MTIPWTLERYIFREMGKTFLLSAVALTGVLGLGGGVREMIKLGEVTPGQLLRILALVLPLALALTLPVATLFSAAATYGRIAGDNEFVACKSGGINLHILFLPGIVLGLVSATVTFCLINFLVPGMLKNLDQFIAGDVGVLIQQRLKEPKGLRLRDFRMTADSVSIDRDERPASVPSPGGRSTQTIVLRNVAFVEVDHGEWARYGTADALLAEFDHRGERLNLHGRLMGLTFYDRQEGRFVELAQQTVAADELPALFGMKLKFLTLGELWHYRNAPHEWREAAEVIARARVLALREAVFDRAWEEWTRHEEIVLADEHASIRIRASQAARTPRDGAIELSGVLVEETSGERARSYRAERAVVEFARAETAAQCAVRLDAYDVSGQTGDAGQKRVPLAGEAAGRRSKAIFGPITPPHDLLERIENLSVEELVAMEAAESAARLDRTLPVDSRTGLAGPAASSETNAVTERSVKTARAGSASAGVRVALAETSRTISATLHERMAFCAIVIVVVVLAAALGIVFRGAHVVVAFAISFVPAVLLIVFILMGKQIALNADLHGAGILLIWSGIGVVALVDWWVLARVVRR